jgi:hypothetical protein
MAAELLGNPIVAAKLKDLNNYLDADKFQAFAQESAAGAPPGTPAPSGTPASPAVPAVSGTSDTSGAPGTPGPPATATPVRSPAKGP